MKYNNNNSNEKEYNKKRKGGGFKKKTKQTNKQTKNQPVMHNAIAHHPLTDAQLVPEPRSAPPSQLPPVYILGMTFHGMEYPFG